MANHFDKASFGNTFTKQEIQARGFYSNFFVTGPLNQLLTRNQPITAEFIEKLMQRLIELSINMNQHKLTENLLTQYQLAILNNAYLAIGVGTSNLILKHKQLHPLFEQLDEKFPFDQLQGQIGEIEMEYTFYKTLMLNLRSFASFISVITVLVTDPTIWKTDSALKNKLQLVELKLSQESVKLSQRDNQLIKYKGQYNQLQVKLLKANEVRSTQNIQIKALEQKNNMLLKKQQLQKKLQEQQFNTQKKLLEEKNDNMSLKNTQYTAVIKKLKLQRKSQEQYFKKYVHHKNQQTIFYRNHIAKLSTIATSMLGKIKFLAQNSGMVPSLLGNVVFNDNIVDHINQLADDAISQIQNNLGQINVQLDQNGVFNLTQHHGKSQQYYGNVFEKAVQHLGQLQKITAKLDAVIEQVQTFQVNPAPFVNKTEEAVIEKVVELQQKIEALVKTQAQTMANSVMQLNQHSADSNVIEKKMDQPTTKSNPWMDQLKNQQLNSGWTEQQSGIMGSELFAEPEALKQQTVFIRPSIQLSTRQARKQQAKIDKEQMYIKLNDAARKSYFSE